MVKLSVFGNKKYVSLLLEEMREKPARFTELRRMVKSENTLFHRLDEFGSSGLVCRMPVVDSKRPTLGYGLTKKGRDFLGLIDKMKKL